MALSREYIVLMFILGAVLLLGLAATIHRKRTDPADHISAWNQDRTPEQQTRMEALRVEFQAEMWQIARGARQEIELPASRGQPRRDWIFSVQTSIPARQQRHSAGATTLLAGPGPIGRSWETYDLICPELYHESTDSESDEDEYGVPASQAQASIMARIAHSIAQIMPFPTATSQQREMDDLSARLMNRFPSVYSTDEVVQQPNDRVSVVRPLPAVHVRPLPRPRQLPRVYDTIVLEEGGVEGDKIVM